MGLPFLSSQPKRRDNIVAIDLGGYTTKAVLLQRHGEQFSLVNYTVTETPAAEKSLSKEALTAQLKKVNETLGGGRRSATVALGVNDCVFRQVEFPLMPLNDMRQMLKFHSKNYLQQDLSDHVFDCYYLPINPAKAAEAVKANNGPMKQKVMVGGARQQFIEDIQAALKEAGLIPDLVVPGIVGPANAFELAEPAAFAKEIVALVDIGYKTSSITILDCGEIKLNRVVNIGGERLTTGLAEAMGISPVEAEQIKIGMPHEVQSNLETLLNPLGKELRASIDFFEHQNDKPLGHVYLSGGSARNDLILQCLQNELMVPCKSWNPAKSLELALPQEKASEVDQVGPQLTVAIGAAASAF